MKNRYQKRQINSPENVSYFVEKGFSQSIAEVLASRGVNADNYAEIFGSGCFHDAMQMANMSEAVDTINCLIESGGSVLIYGDYDADGLSASSLLSLFFTDNGVDNDVIIPKRDDGYGLHVENVLRSYQKKYYDLIITVDCGISNANEVEQLQNELGVEIIVTDHHELPDVLPNCICVNPKLGYPFSGLSGSGVAWKLVEAMAGREVAVKYSDLAIIGTIADLMPLEDENRSLVKLGLSNFNHKSLKKIAELSKCNTPLSCNDISMKIAPRINAAGRVDSPLVALDVLLCRDNVNFEKVDKLMQINETRKQMLDDIIADANTMCDGNTIENERMVFLYSNYWHHGLLGIAASRYKEQYYLPAIILALDGDKYVGSARSVDGIDLFAVFTQCKDLLLQYGGHKMSVGFSVSKDNLLLLRQKLASIFGGFNESCYQKCLYYDVELAGDVTEKDVYELSNKLQPLLPQDKLVCRVNGVVAFANAFGKDNAHLSVSLTNGMELKGFFKGELAPFIRNGANVDLICSLDYDSYSKRIVGLIDDIVLCNSVCFDELYKLNLLKTFVPNTVSTVNETYVKTALCKNSCLVVFDDYETFLQESKRFDFEDYFVDIFFDNSLSRKTVVVSPLENYDFSKYSNVIVFCNTSMARVIPNAVYYQIVPANETLYSIQLNRDICLQVYSALKNKSSFDSIKGVFDKYLTGKISYQQFTVAIRVFEELDLIKVLDKFTVQFNSQNKTELTNSSIYNCFQIK